ncbi:tetratricopeptide repeat protein [Foetidibacter luteolus]|uniref:tetratricopeptide repeat protein n=1 Tax=Foetidibacter luteolus TaxID=2608880 RepID=UPI00129AF2D7|nr:tetratricopeptide repeat protein [Foetidibacter luteolus]
MSNSLQTDYILDELLKGRLTLDEATAQLRQEGVEDTAMEINLHKAAAVAIQRYNIIQQVSRVHGEFTASGKPTGRIVSMQPFKILLRAAAAILVIAGLWFVYQYATVTDNSMYAEIYQPYELNTDRSQPTDPPPNGLVELFRKKDYAGVTKLYPGIEKPGNREKFLAGFSNLQTGNYGQAEALFREILEQSTQGGTGLYSDEAEFYLGLVLLKLGKNEEAVGYFKKIKENPFHTFHARVNRWTLTRLQWLD